MLIYIVEAVFILAIIAAFVFDSKTVKKSLDQAKYRRRMNQCCCFHRFYTGKSVRELIIKINQQLDNDFCIYVDEEKYFVRFHEKYRLWLLDNYLRDDFLFSHEFKNLFTRKNKKRWKVDWPKDIQKEYLKDEVFFLQTVFSYTEKRCYEDFVDIEEYVSHYDTKLTGFGIVVNKARLASAVALYNFGDFVNEWEIEHIKERIKNAT